MKSAALAAGYSESYASSGIQKQMKNSSKIREKLEKITSVIPEKYKALCRLRLGDVAEIEGTVLADLKNKPDKALRHPQLLKQIKQSAGVIGEDQPTHPPMISIDKMIVLQGRVRDKGEQALLDMEAKETQKA